MPRWRSLLTISMCWMSLRNRTSSSWILCSWRICSSNNLCLVRMTSLQRREIWPLIKSSLLSTKWCLVERILILLVILVLKIHGLVTCWVKSVDVYVSLVEKVDQSRSISRSLSTKNISSLRCRNEFLNVSLPFTTRHMTCVILVPTLEKLLMMVCLNISWRSTETISTSTSCFWSCCII